MYVRPAEEFFRYFQIEHLFMNCAPSLSFGREGFLTEEKLYMQYCLVVCSGNSHSGTNCSVY